MTTFAKLLLSGSTNGEPIAVTATSITSGTLIHTAVSGTSGIDEIYLYAINTDTTSAHEVTLGWGGTTTADLICNAVVIDSSFPVPIICGLPLRNGLVVKASADAANFINIFGFVNRIGVGLPPLLLTPNTGNLSIVSYPPTIINTDTLVAVPTVGSVAFTGYAPTIG